MYSKIQPAFLSFYLMYLLSLSHLPPCILLSLHKYQPCDSCLSATVWCCCVLRWWGSPWHVYAVRTAALPPSAPPSMLPLSYHTLALWCWWTFISLGRVVFGYVVSGCCYVGSENATQYLGSKILPITINSCDTARRILPPANQRKRYRNTIEIFNPIWPRVSDNNSYRITVNKRETNKRRVHDLIRIPACDQPTDLSQWCCSISWPTPWDSWHTSSQSRPSRTPASWGRHITGCRPPLSWSSSWSFRPVNTHTVVHTYMRRHTNTQYHRWSKHRCSTSEWTTCACQKQVQVLATLSNTWVSDTLIKNTLLCFLLPCHSICKLLTSSFYNSNDAQTACMFLCFTISSPPTHNHICNIQSHCFSISTHNFYSLKHLISSVCS